MKLLLIFAVCFILFIQSSWQLPIKPGYVKKTEQENNNELFFSRSRDKQTYYRKLKELIFKLGVITQHNVSDEDYADYGKRNVPSTDKKLNKVHFAGNIGKKTSAADNEKTGKKQKRWNESEIFGR